MWLVLALVLVGGYSLALVLGSDALDGVSELALVWGAPCA